METSGIWENLCFPLALLKSLAQQSLLAVSGYSFRGWETHTKEPVNPTAPSPILLWVWLELGLSGSWMDFPRLSAFACCSQQTLHGKLWLRHSKREEPSQSPMKGLSNPTTLTGVPRQLHFKPAQGKVCSLQVTSGSLQTQNEASSPADSHLITERNSQPRRHNLSPKLLLQPSLPKSSPTQVFSLRESCSLSKSS